MKDRAFKNNFLQYLFNLLLGLDQLFNVVLLGDPDESLSTRTARAIRSGKPKKWVAKFGKFVDFLFDNPLYTLEKNHIYNSFEEDEKAGKELWSWIKEDK